MRRDWRTAALCRTAGDPDLWFPASTTAPHSPQISEAKTICARCPVRAQCLRAALESGDTYGIWGGHTEGELKALRRQLTLRAKATA